MTQEQIMQLIFIVLPFVLAVVAVPAAKLFIAKLPVQQQAYAMQVVHSAVQAAEQTSAKNTSGLSGIDKKALAEQFAATALKKAGLSVDPQVINMLIEAAVFALNQSKPIVLEASQNANTVVQTPGSPVGIPTASTPSGMPLTSA